STYGISSTKNSRYIVRGNELVLLETKAKSNMGSYSTLQSFVEYGIKNFSAEKMALIFWNHGGAMQGVCYDENNGNDPLTNYEVKKALTSAFNNTKRTAKFEWVGYDACLMAVADVASFNSQFFNYMVSSQESEPGEGWDYDGWVKYLLNNINVNTTDLLKKICDTYYDKVAETYNSYGGEYRGYNDTTLSVLDLSKAATFDSEFEKVASGLKTKITSSSKLSSLVSSSQQFGYDDKHGYIFDVFDADDVFSAINTTYSINISALTTALNNYVIYNKVGKDSSGACGLCLFSAQSGYTSKSQYNTSNTNYTNWLSINNSCGSLY
ncbi:MAG: clostripain-related cysteine peptidase, partial [Bacilli bacterium]|nr:clostripain-related cysteine peptidase [Bacilli bacterium]